MLGSRIHVQLIYLRLTKVTYGSKLQVQTTCWIPLASSRFLLRISILLSKYCMTEKRYRSEDVCLSPSSRLQIKDPGRPFRMIHELYSLAADIVSESAIDIHTNHNKYSPKTLSWMVPCNRHRCILRHVSLYHVPIIRFVNSARRVCSDDLQFLL